MDTQVTDDAPCASQLTIGDLFALIRHINESNATISPAQLSSPKIDLSFVIVVIVSSIAIVVNMATLLAISQVRKVSAYLRLVISLSISDILIGVRVLFGSFDARPFLGSDLEMCIFIYLRGIKMTSHLISLFNLLGLGLDHYCAIMSPLKHRSKMSVSRTNAMILLFWIVSALCGFSDFFIPAPSYDYCSTHSFMDENNNSSCEADNFFDILTLTRTNTTPGQDLKRSANVSYDYSNYYPWEQPDQENSLGVVRNLTNISSELSSDGVTLADLYAWPSELSNYTEEGFCYSVMCSRYDTEYFIFTVAALLLLVMSYIYTRVCVKIYSMRRLLVGRSKRTFRRNKKGLITTMCIVGIFMICWLPFCIFTTMTLINMRLYPHLTEEYYGVSVKLDSYLYALLLFNCLCDPIIYALRMREVKLGYHRLLARCFKKYRQKASSSEGHSYVMTSRYSSQSSAGGSFTRNNKRISSQQNPQIINKDAMSPVMS